MQSKSIVITGIVLALSFITLSIFGEEKGTNSDHDWLFRWEAKPGLVFKVVVDRTELGGNTFRMRVLSIRGQEFLKMDGEAFISAIPFSNSDNSDEELLITHWSSGNSYMIAVLRGSVDKAEVVNKIVFSSSTYTLYDVDDDGIPEIVTFSQKSVKGKPTFQWPYFAQFYKWNGNEFSLIGESEEEIFRKCATSHMTPISH
jgi:hypothetical protein